MKKCPQCGAELDDNDLFCDKCGYDLRENQMCPKCSAQLKQNSSFCPKCGTKIFTKNDKEELIDRYQKEINSFRHKKSLLIKDAIISFVIGALFLIVSIVLLFILDSKGNNSALYIVGFVLSFIFIIVGIAISIVQSAVFDTRINNRISAIDKLSSRKGV